VSCVAAICFGRVPCELVLLFLGSIEEGGGVLEYGFDGGVLDSVVGEVYKARGSEGMEDLEGN
jgi:hypothetical protein